MFGKFGTDFAQKTASLLRATDVYSATTNPINSRNFHYLSGLSADTVCLSPNRIQTGLKKMCESLFKHKFECEANPDQIKVLMNNISRNSNDDIKLITKRYNALLEDNSNLTFDLLEGEFKNSDYLIDNLAEISSVLTRDKRKLLGPDRNRLIQCLNKKELELLSSKADKPEEFRKLAKEIIYNSTQHDIKLGNKSVTVDSSDVVAIVSGKQSLSYFNTGSSKDFEKTARDIAEVATHKDGEQYYYKISEGILKQHPELVKIVDDLNSTIETSTLPIKETLTKFFNQKAKTGELPKTITLRTVVPDENALILPKDTFEIFKSRMCL